MSNSQKEHWEIQFESELVHVQQSEGTGLPFYTMDGVLQGAAEVQWHVLGAATSQKNRAVGTKLQRANLDHTKVTAKLDNYEITEDIMALDEFKTSASHRRGYAQSFIWEFNRNIDTEILREAKSSATVQTGAGYAKLDKALLAETKALASKHNWKGGAGDWALVITPDVEDVLLQIGEVLSRDENPSDVVFVNGKVTRLYNFDIIVSNELDDLQTNSDATQVDCFAWHKFAMGYKLGTPPSTIIERNPETNATQVTGMMSCTARGILGNGIINVRVDSDAT